MKYKTWICCIYGGGTPTYLVSAESEKQAWSLIRKALGEKYRRQWYLQERDCGGLVEVPGWHADEERIDDIHDLYAPGGKIKNGTFEGFSAC